MAQCQRYVEAFCEIMGYTEDDFMPEYYFIGQRNPDIFGVVFINDMFFNMSNLCLVIGEYDHWKEKYGDDLPKVIEEWYYYHIGDSDKWKGYISTNTINLQHWLMGARPTAEATSQEYKDQQAKEIERVEKEADEAFDALLETIKDKAKEE